MIAINRIVSNDGWKQTKILNIPIDKYVKQYKLSFIANGIKK